MSGVLEGCKVGDQIYSVLPFGEGVTIYTIDRLTKTRVVCGNLQFRIRDGLKIGSQDSWSTLYAYKITSEIIRKYESQRLAKQFNTLATNISKIKVTEENYSIMEEAYTNIKKIIEEAKRE